MFRFSYIILLVLLSNCVTSQQLKIEKITSNTKTSSRQKGSITNEKKYEVNPGFRLTSVAIRIPQEQKFDGAYIEVKKTKYYLSKDPHVDPKNGFINSNLIVFDGEISSFLLYSGDIKGQVEFFFINASFSFRPIKNSNRTFESDDLCIQPSMIHQDVWRLGLTEPNYSRSFHDVKNLIIHHSAGSNSNNDYTSVVRNIYIYHTEGNGWDDIGYNYLIAPDGTVFMGRDAGTDDQDNVMGAHFCSSNHGVMGVCLLGTFTDIAPAQNALSSLIHLLSWKASKDNLNPIGTSSHPLDDQLNVISGHRQGCATACPGDQLFNLLDSIRNEVNTLSLSCNSVTNLQPYSLTNSKGTIYNINGKPIFSWNENDSNVDLENHLTSGFYVIKSIRNKKMTVKKVVIN